MKELPIIKASRGLNSAIDPKRQGYSDESGFEFLEAAVNVDITDGNRIVRRPGYTQLSDTAAHSIIAVGNVLYCVLDGDLVRLDAGYSGTVLHANIGAAKVRYTLAGQMLFYSNGSVNGYIVDSTRYAWAPTEYVGPETTHEYVAMPVGKHLAYHRGRVYVSVDNVLYYSEALNYLAYNQATNFIPFSSNIRMILSVGSVLYVADELGVYALVGNSPVEFELIPVTLDYVIEDTALTTVSPIVLGKPIPGTVGFVTARNAIYALLGTGSVIDITDDRLRLPDASSGMAYYFKGAYTALITV